MVVFKIFKKILLFSPGQIFRYKSKNYRRLYYFFSRYFHLITYLRRCYKINFKSEKYIDENKGYLILNDLNIPDSSTNEPDDLPF